MFSRSPGPKQPEPTILIVEDDASIAMMLVDILESTGKHTHVARSGAEAEAVVGEVHPDLIILDLMLPDTDGLVLCANLKARSSAPILICSASHRKRDTILGFKLGADDFITKPFDVDELEARVEALLRRASAARAMEQQALNAARQAAIAYGVHPQHAPPPAHGPPAPGVARQERSERLGDLMMDHARRRVSVGSHEVHVTPTEYRLLAALMTQPDEILSREDLMHAVWGSQEAGVGRSIDAHVRRLRSKLEAAPTPAPDIVSVRGFGYKITRQPGQRQRHAA